jgi:6-phosphogluconolactonase
MNTLRRCLSLFVLLTAPFALLGVGETASPPAAKTYRAYVGTYTTKTHSKGIYQFTFDSATGKMSAPDVAAETGDPSWVAVHPNGKFLYSVSEAGKGSTVKAFAMDAKTGQLTLVNELPSLGEDPCYLSFDRTGKFLLVANYTSGNVAVFPIQADGKLAEHTALQKDTGTPGPNQERQDAPHAHFITPSEHNLFVYVADLGLDRVLVYKFDASRGTLEPMSNDAAAAVKPGSGPRHAAFSPDGKFMYVVSEMASAVTVFANDRETFRSVQVTPMLPAGFSGRNDAAEIEIHPSGKFLYASNRGHESIVEYTIDAKTGMLTLAGDTPTGGKEPRHFAIDPSGKYLLAENQLSDSVVEFRIDPASGKLNATRETITVPSPVCIAFIPIP